VSIAAFARSLKDALVAAPAFETTLRLTLILLMVYGPATRAVGVQLVGVTMLVIPPLLTNRVLWWALVFFAGVANARAWFVIDIHQYLILYWTAACALAISVHDAERRAEVLRGSARALVAVVFLFAAFWKVLGGEYADGSFLHFTFLTDPRFREVAAALTGSPASELAAGVDAMRFASQNGLFGVPIELPTSSALRYSTLMLSWAGMFVEGLIGLLHAARGERLAPLRHTVYWAFVAGTYFLFPVMGFAFVLGVLGYAQCTDKEPGRRFAYLVLFGVIHLTVLPWQSLLRLF
jgi:hypothetical protein